MTEGVSLAGIIETPIVIHIGMRPGPATGLPTRTEQADLNLALYAGHGEFPRAIFTPGTPEECFMVAEEAFRIADTYQIPVFILTDQYLLDSIVGVEEEDLKRLPVTNHIVETASDYARYTLTDDGISPRGVPGNGAGLVGIDSDEHDEAGHITESALVRQAMHDKRLSKLVGIRSEALMPTTLGDVPHADTVIVTWGSNRGVLEEALEILDNEGVAGLHFHQVYPLPTKAKKLLSKKKVVVMENNAGGQFANLLTLEYGIKVSENILKYNGDPFSVEEVVKKLKKLSTDL
jgi:2-oxoglutarate ferredoxin oxidoreductase subunit alpha